MQRPWTSAGIRDGGPAGDPTSSPDGGDGRRDVADAEFTVVVADGSPSVRLTPVATAAADDASASVDRVAEALNDIATATSSARFGVDGRVTADAAAMSDPGAGLLHNVVRIIDLLGLADPSNGGVRQAAAGDRPDAGADIADELARIVPFSGTFSEVAGESELPRSAGRFTAQFRQSAFPPIEENHDDADGTAIGLDPSDGESGESLRRAVRAGMPGTGTLSFGYTGTLGAATLMLLPLLGGLDVAQAAAQPDTGTAQPIAGPDDPAVAGVADMQARGGDTTATVVTRVDAARGPESIASADPGAEVAGTQAAAAMAANANGLAHALEMRAETPAEAAATPIGDDASGGLITLIDITGNASPHAGDAVGGLFIPDAIGIETAAVGAGHGAAAAAASNAGGHADAAAPPLADVLDTAADSLQSILENVAAGGPPANPSAAGVQASNADATPASGGAAGPAHGPANPAGAVLSALVAVPDAHQAHGPHG